MMNKQRCCSECCLCTHCESGWRNQSR